MERAARPPSQYSVCDLIIHGVLSETDVLEDGNITEEVRMQAERLMKSKHPSLKRPKSAPQSIRPVREEGDLKCTICFSQSRTHVFIPCFHFHTCQSCSLRLKDCPVCRSRIECIQRIWY